MPSVRFEITNKCNLSCPSCIEGRLNHARQHEAFEYVDVELCRKIFQRFSESDIKYDIYLYLFCEPCLHPYLDEILDIADSFDLKIYISSNLNVKKDWGRLLRHPSLKRLTVSVSGITQSVYERGHRGGRIDLVLKNLQEIAAIAPKSDTEVLVFFHQYSDNAEDEQQFRELCATHGFTFVPSPAYFMYSPWDADRHFSGKTDPILTDGIVNTLPRLLVDRDLFMQRTAHLSTIPCSFEYAQDIALDCRGNVHQGCCMEPFALDKHAGAFLSMSEEQINAVYRNYTLCKDCKSKGYHVQFSLIPHVEYTQLAKRRRCEQKHFPLNKAIYSFIQRTAPLDFLKNTPIHIYGVIGNAGIATLLTAQGYRMGDSIDDNPALEGSLFCNMRVRPLKSFSTEELHNDCVIICFIRPQKDIDALKETLRQRGVSHVYALHEIFYLEDMMS